MMKLKLKSDKIILTDRLFDGYVGVENEKIVTVCKQDFPADETWDFTGLYLAPGFIDMHAHGGGGACFLDGSEQDAALACDTHLKCGTTSILPTLSAAPLETMRQSVATVVSAKRKGMSKANILGVHLEGPYVSPEYCGAQRTQFLAAPKANAYQPLLDEYAGEIARWTYAPELDKNGQFCRDCTSRGVLVSAGHTGATYEDMQTAIQNGCALVTHLYSCTSTVTRENGFRRLGVIETAFLRDDIAVELIADGKHLPPKLIQMIVKIKGTDNVVLATDALEIAGTDIKSGYASGAEFIVEDGVCKLKDRSAFAGSIATANMLVKTLWHLCETDIVTAVKMLTKNPARLLKINKGEIAVGKDADFAVFDDNVSVSAVFVGGQRVK